MKTFIQAIFFALLTSSAFAQIWENPITGNDISANPYVAGQTVATGITVSGIGRAGVSEDNTADNTYRADQWSTSNSIQTGDYFSFTITPNAGQTINFTNFVFEHQRSTDGPQDYAVRSSLDGYSGNLASGNGTVSTSATTITVALGAAFDNITQPITFRIYGYDANDNGNDDYYQINSFEFNGTISAIADRIWQENITGDDISSTNPYANNIAGAVNTSSRFVTGNLTVRGPARGNGLSAATEDDAFRATSWSGDNQTEAIADNEYFEFTLTPASGNKISLLSLFIDGTRSSQGPTDYSLRTGTSFATVVQNGTIPNGQSNFTFDLSAYANITSPITFRFYGWDAGSGLGSFQINDFYFNGAIALPAVFGSVEAVKTADGLNIKWSTEEETNNDYFEVQASKDGVDFKTVKVVQSTDGDSDVKQDYEVTITEADVAALLAIPAVLGLLSFGFSRRTRLIGFVATLMLLAVNFVACNKNSDGIDAGGADKVFIRIKQVDVNGDAKYSKVIQVVNN